MLTTKLCLFTFLADCEEGSTGRTFVTGFLENHDSDIALGLFASTIIDVNITVDVSSPLHTNPSVSESVVMTVGTSVNIELDKTLSLHTSIIENKGLQITTSDDVLLFGVNHVAGSCDAFTILPEESLGNEYVAFTHYPPNTASELGVVAIEDSTTINMTFPPGWLFNIVYEGVTYTGGSVLSVTLNKYQTFKVEDPLDLSGTHMVSDKKFAAYSGNRYTAVESGPSLLERSHLVEQLLPVKYWGTEFYTVPFTDTEVDLVQIVTSEPDTVISMLDQIIPVGPPFNSRIRSIPRGYHAKITADKPIMVAQYAQSINGNNPAVTLLPSVDNYLSAYSFVVPDLSAVASRFSNYIMIVIEQSQRDGLIIEGAMVNPTLWTPITGSSPTMVGQRIPVSNTQHKVYHTDGAKFSAVVYGVDAEYCAYSYPLGFCMTKEVCNRITVKQSH